MKRKRNRRRGAARRRTAKVETGGGGSAETPQGEDPSPSADTPSPSSEDSSSSDDDPSPSGDEPATFAGGRVTARLEGMLELQREIQRQAAEREEKRGPETEDNVARFAIASVRTLLLLKVAELTEQEEPVSPDVVAQLALALVRIERSDRMRAERERAAAKNPVQPPMSQAEREEKVAAALHKSFKETFLHPGRVNRLDLPPWKDSWDDMPSALGRSRAQDTDSDAKSPDETPDSAPGADGSGEDAPDSVETDGAEQSHGEGDAADAHGEGTHDARDQDPAPDAPDEPEDDRVIEARVVARWRKERGLDREPDVRDMVPNGIPCEGASMWAALW